jgi:proteic killer suppression protein
MIRSFRYKWLQAFWQAGSTRGINAQWSGRLERILDALDRATQPSDMNVPGFRFHALIGRDSSRYSVSVNANWRISFAFDGPDAIDVDLEDYH